MLSEIGYLFTLGRLRTTSKNFSRSNSSIDSATAGFGSTNNPISNSFEPMNPFVATLCLFRKAAEKPEAHTYTEQRVETFIMNKNIKGVSQQLWDKIK